jgi:para-nitrobenzyl esterase
MSVQQHVLSPLTKGLFHKAVMCSGGGVNKILSTGGPEKSYDFWHAVMKRVGAKNLEEFRAVPVEEFSRLGRIFRKP